MAKKPQPKPPPKAGGGARSGQTLGQATGGKPGKVQPAAPVTRSLGLGLGLNAQQRGNFQQAVQGGTGGQWLGAHPGVQQRIGQINPNSAQGGMQQQRIQNFMGTGQTQRPPQPPTTQRQPRGAQQLGPQMGQLVGGMQTPGAGGYTPSQRPAQIGGGFQGNFAQGTGDQLTGKAPYTGPMNIPQGGQQQIGSGQMGPSFGQGGPYGGGQMGGQSPYMGGSGGNMAWNNPNDPNSGYQPQYQTPQNTPGYAGQQGGYGGQIQNMAPQYSQGGFGGQMGGQQGGMGSYLSSQQSRPADPYGYGQGGGGYGGVGQGASAGYGGRQQGAGWGYGGQYGGGQMQANPNAQQQVMGGQTRSPMYGGGGYM